MWLIVVAIVGFSVAGVLRTRFDDALIRFFDSDVPAFEQYAEVSEAFEGDATDVIVLFEADDVAAPEAVRAISDFLLDAQFVPGVRGVISPFSLRIVGEDGVEEPLFPYPPLPQDEMAARIDDAYGDVNLLPRLMAADRAAMVVIVPITEAGDDPATARRAQITALTALADRASQTPGMEVRLGGFPVLRDSVNAALVRDIVLLNVFGVVVGILVSIATFRSVAVGLLTIPGPMVAAALTVGLHGHLGVAINTITVTLPVLALVLSASHSIHLTFERARQAGRDPTRAAVRAVRRVATACVFAAMTTAIAFAALSLSGSEIIAELGRMGMLSTLASVVTVLLIQTAVFSSAARFGWFRREMDRLHDHMPSALGLGRMPRLGLRLPRTVTWSALAVLVVSTALYSQAGPRYSLLDSLSDDSPVLAVFDAIEDKVAPISQLLVPVRSNDPEVIARVHGIVADVTGKEFVQSLTGIDADAETVNAALPEILARRFVTEDGERTIVSAPFRYVNGTETIALADAIDAAIAADPDLAGTVVAPVTGLPVMSARVAGVILDEINRSLLIALLGVAVLIVVWLGNLRIALISLVPNMLPVTLIGAWLTLSGRGLEFANGLALTVAFGIAVDDTLHVLNRLRLRGAVDALDTERLQAAIREVAPALVTTSLVLMLGMSGVFFADSRSVADFGKIAITVYGLALVADLLVLPAILAVFGPRTHLKRGKENP